MMRHDANGSLIRELKASFGVAAMNREARLGLNAAEWRQYQTIGDGFAKAREALNANYAREYKTRVEMARRHLIDRAAAKTKTFKHRTFGHDLFDGRAITRQAQREVRFEHEQQLQVLGAREHQAKESFLEGCIHRRELRGHARRDFAEAVTPAVPPNQRKQRRRQQTR